MKLLPIGTVVLLKGGEKKIMIYAHNVVNMKNREKYDYLACMYPEGYMGDEYNIFFNNTSIAKIISQEEKE